MEVVEGPRCQAEQTLLGINKGVKIEDEVFSMASKD